MILEGKRVVRYGPSSAREPVERRPLRNSAENVVFRSPAKFFHDVCESVFFLLSSSLQQNENDRRILEKILRSLPFLRFCQILDEMLEVRASTNNRTKKEKFHEGGDCIFRRFKRALISKKYGESLNRAKPCYRSSPDLMIRSLLTSSTLT